MPSRIPYYQSGGDNIAALLMRQGDIRANQAMQTANIWGNVVQNLGQIGAQAYGARQEQKKEKEESAAVEEAFATWDGQDPMSLYRSLATKIGPERATKLVGGYSSMMRLSQTQEPDPADFKTTVGALAALPPEFLTKHWQTLAPGLAPSVKKFLGFDLPPEASEELIQYLPALDAKLNGKEPSAEPKVVGGALVSPEGKVLYREEEAPKQDTRSLEVRLLDAQQRGDQGEVSRLLSLRRQMAAAGREPDKPQATRFAKTTVVVDGKPVLANYDSASGSYLDVNTGQKLANVQPASQASGVQKWSAIGPIVKSIKELSERINTGSGLLAKAKGALEKQAAKVNYDNDVAEYEAIVQAFTPMLARMMGHTGVLTQQDVDSARAILPRPGESRDLRDRKVARIQALIEASTGEASSTTDAAGESPGTLYFDAQGNLVKQGQ